MLRPLLFRQLSSNIYPKLPLKPKFSHYFSSSITHENIRNVAIIAHVDHGKTTLVDSLLKTSGVSISHNRQLDSNELEKERGITILSKVTRIPYKGSILNIVDTPGHADFGAEVERVLSMVDGVCLVVDAVEGPKTQTKFVLKKALMNPLCKTIVVINKVDRPNVRAHGDCENEIFDLFLSFGAADEQIEYPTFYASGRSGWVEEDWKDIRNKSHPKGVEPLLDAIIKYIEPPKTHYQDHFSYLVTLLDYSQNVGVITTGKIYSGRVQKNDLVYIIGQDGKLRGQTTIRSIYITEGSNRRDLDTAQNGEIIGLSFWKGISPQVGETISSIAKCQAIPSPQIDPPVISVTISINSSPLVGKDGTFVTLSAIGKRLKKESASNVSLEVEESPNKDSYEVRGRGELQISILLETLRREGYEMSVSAPNVIFKKDEQGNSLEPWEEIEIEVPNEVSAAALDRLAYRQAEIIDMKPLDNVVRMIVHCSSRNFMGMRPFLRDISKGEAVVISEILDYRPLSSTIKFDRSKLIISSSPGITTPFSMESLQAKGTLFVPDGVPTYEGMILGEHNGSNDIEMNAVKSKHLTNMRTKGHEESVKLNIKGMNIESCLSYILPDELLEITPKRVCMRKKLLTHEERKAAAKKSKK